MNGQPPRIRHRRDWLRGVVAAALGAGVGRGATTEDVIEQIRAKGRAARMQPFEVSETAHFVGVGDALPRYRDDALKLCEAFAKDYFAHFEAKGFALAWPAARLPVVILGGPTSYAAFEQAFPDEAIGGNYDLDANWLVTFDFRPLANAPRDPGAGDPRLDNTLTLVHETFHQLSYNTGMLDRKLDVPRCVDEGLGTYAETWRPGGKGRIGANNVRRHRELDEALHAGGRWIPVKQLLDADKAFDDEKTEHMAYAISSLLVAKLVKDPMRLPQFRDYLKAVQAANDPARRVALAEAHFGDLTKLDRDIRR